MEHPVNATIDTTVLHSVIPPQCSHHHHLRLDGSQANDWFIYWALSFWQWPSLVRRFFVLWRSLQQPCVEINGKRRRERRET